MTRTAHIRLQSSDVEMRFDWLDYDGDDCFRDFHVTYVSGRDERRFEFGPCVLWGLRKLSRFFADPAQQTAGLGFDTQTSGIAMSIVQARAIVWWFATRAARCTRSITFTGRQCILPTRFPKLMTPNLNAAPPFKRAHRKRDR
jgi:hypothetical protein